MDLITISNRSNTSTSNSPSVRSISSLSTIKSNTPSASSTSIKSVSSLFGGADDGSKDITGPIVGSTDPVYVTPYLSSATKKQKIFIHTDYMARLTNINNVTQQIRTIQTKQFGGDIITATSDKSDSIEFGSTESKSNNISDSSSISDISDMSSTDITVIKLVDISTDKETRAIINKSNKKVIQVGGNNYVMSDWN